MASRSAVDPVVKQKLRKVVIGAMTGTVVEWYDFIIYATAATIVFGKVFFPKSDDPLTGVISALLVYAVGFVARPLGGIVFGYLGDRFGRQPMLQLSLLLMGASTFAIGCIPSIDTIGYWAPVLLVVCRLMQGFAAGGEWGGAVLIVAEHAQDNRRAFWTSWPQAALPLGNLAATLVLGVLTFVLHEDAFIAWGWRCAFWLAALIGLIGFYIRKNVEDAPIAKELVAKAEAPKLLDVFRDYPRQVIVAMGLRLTENIIYQVVITFTITYLIFRKSAEVSTILSLMVVANIFHFAIVPFVGLLADRIGRKPVYLAGVVSAIVWSFVGFRLLDTGSSILIFATILGGLIVHTMMYAPYAAMLPEMFPTRVRYLGVSFANQATSVIGGGIAPIICTALLRAYQSYIPIAIYLSSMAVISIIAVLAYRETKGISLRAVDLADEERRAHANSVGAGRLAVSHPAAGE